MHEAAGRSIKLVVISLLLILTAAGAAFARTGYDANPRSVVFYFGETSGNGDSQDFSGYGLVKLCTDGDNVGGGNSYVGQYLRNRTLAKDEILKDVSLRYDAAPYASGNFQTTSDNNYHTYAGWSAVPSAPDTASGFVATRTASLSCP